MGLRHVIVRSDESVTENQKLSYAMYTLMPRRKRTQPNIAVAKNVGAIIAAPPASETMPHTRVPSARASLGPPAYWARVASRPYQLPQRTVKPPAAHPHDSGGSALCTPRDLNPEPTD